MLFKRLPFLSAFYLFSLIICVVTIFQLVARFGESKENYEEMVDSSMNFQRSLTNLSWLASEIEGSKERTLLNDAPDDVAGEYENIRKFRASFNEELKSMKSYLSNPEMQVQYDSLVSLAEQDQSLTDILASLQNYRAIDLFYVKQLPLYNKQQSIIHSMIDANFKTLENNVKTAGAQFDKKDQNLLTWLSICVAVLTAGLITVSIREARRYRSEQILKKERDQEQKENMRRDFRGQEQDRNILGTELHDNINQQLAVVKLKLSMALQEPDRTNEIIAKIIEHVNELIEEIRVLSRALVNPMSKNITLKNSISELVQSLEDLLPRIEFNLYIEEADEEKFISPEIKVNIFRIVQEQLNNILKHADATIVNIYLTYDAGELRLTIEDNGNGFDATKPNIGVGLNSIYQRAKAFEGSAELDTSPGKGCVLSTTFPIS